MDTVNFALLGALIAASFLTAFGSLYLLALVDTRRAQRETLINVSEDDQIVFLFDDERLVNATADARQVLAAAPKVGSDWARFLAVFLPRFPSLRHDISELADHDHMSFEARDKSAVLHAEWRRGLARLRLIDHETGHVADALDRHSVAAMEREIETLRGTAEHTPFPIWRERADGTITWANSAYLALADAQSLETDVPTWPPRRLFEIARTGQSRGHQGSRRIALTKDAEGVQRDWFDCYSAALGDEAICSAVSADAIVKAQSELRDFVQTLTKTFAHLPIGLAIFDRKRQLALFNPALTDLTTLAPEFLSLRPTLASFLDRLREKQMMPEPKNYKNWRQQMADLEAEAVDGTYEDTWHIPTGQIYRVTGRPHPGGAVALLIEDISAEISLTRRFRAELETGQAVIDSLDEAIAVFSPSGVLTMTNTAYEMLWGGAEDALLQDVNIVETSRLWHSKCAPSPIWGDVRDFVGSSGDRVEWSAEARLWDGRRLTCRFTPLAGGTTMAAFDVKEPVMKRIGQVLAPTETAAAKPQALDA